MPIKLKLDEAGHVVVQDGKPVYTHDDGVDRPFDAQHALDTISARNGEAKTHREQKEAAEARLKVYELKPGEYIDPAKAKEALSTVDSLSKGDLVKAGEVERVKAEIVAATEEKYKPTVEENKTLKLQLEDSIIGGAFDRSQFIKDKVAVPVPFLRAQYGRNFKIENGKMVAYDQAGNKMLSKIKPGEFPEFDEAMEIMVNADPYKDDILKGRGSAGSGSTGGAGGLNGVGGKQIPRAQWDGMNHDQRTQALLDKATVVD